MLQPAASMEQARHLKVQKRWPKNPPIFGEEVFFVGTFGKEKGEMIKNVKSHKSSNNYE